MERLFNKYYYSICCEKFIDCCKKIAGSLWYGVDISKEHIADNFEACVWEPSVIKVNALTAAAEAACMILSVDETIKSPKSGDGAPPQMPGRGMGRPF